MPRQLLIKMGKGRFILDPFSVFLGMMAMIVGLITFAFYIDTNSNLASKGLFITLLTLVGMFVGMTVLKSPFDTDLMKREMNHITRWAMIGFIAIVALQYAAIQAYSLPLSTVIFADKIFYMSVAISEAYFFRFALLQLLYQWLKHSTAPLFTASLTTSVIFLMYHAGIYSSDIVAMTAVFVSSMALCIIAILSNRIASPMLSHMIANGVAG